MSTVTVYYTTEFLMHLIEAVQQWRNYGSRRKGAKALKFPPPIFRDYHAQRPKVKFVFVV